MCISSLEDHKLLAQLTFIKRKRTLPSVILLGMILYFKGLSYRRARDILSLFDAKVSHTAIWSRIRKHAAHLKDDLWQGDMPSRIVVDETGLVSLKLCGEISRSIASRI